MDNFWHLILYQAIFFWTGPNSQHLQKTKLNAAKIMISVINRVENKVGKGKKAGYQHFLLLPECFQNPIVSGLSWNCVFKS